jgi:hypothetical protein
LHSSLRAVAHSTSVFHFAIVFAKTLLFKDLAAAMQLTFGTLFVLIEQDGDNKGTLTNRYHLANSLDVATMFQN